MGEDIVDLFLDSGWKSPDGYPILGMVRKHSEELIVVTSFNTYKVVPSGDDLKVKIYQLQE